MRASMMGPCSKDYARCLMCTDEQEQESEKTGGSGEKGRGKRGGGTQRPD